MHETELETAIEKLSRLYDVDILYSDDLLKGVKVNCEISNMSVEEALKIMLKNTEIAFREESATQIILYPKQNQNIDVYGWIIDADTGETLPYANIFLEGTNRGTSSNSEGRFTLLDVPSSSTLLADYIGYNSSQIYIDDTDLSPVLYVSLTPQSLESDPVIVQDKSRDIFSISRNAGQISLNSRLFDQLPVVAGRDMIRALTYLPGVDQRSNSSTVLNIRGGLPSENLVTLDGITLYHMDHAFGILSAVPTAIVKDVQLFKSNFPAKFGGKLSGVVEMTGKTGDFKQAHIDFEANEMAVQGMVQVPVANYATILLSGRHSLNTYLARDLYKTINQTPPFISDFVQTTSGNNTSGNRSIDITFWDTYAKISLTPTSKDLLNFSLFRSQDLLSADHGELNTFSSREWTWSNSGLSASWFRAWNKSFQTDVLVTQSAYKINQDSNVVEGLYVSSNQASRVKNKIDDFSIKFENQWDGIKNHSFSFGYQFTQVKTDFVEWHPQFAKILTHGIESKQNIFYLQDDWQATNRLQIRPSLRVTHFDLADKYFHSPRLAANYSLAGSIKLKASAGQYHQFVSNFGYEFPNYIGQLSWLVNDNTVLKPGKSNHYTIGFNWDGKLLNLDVEYYHKQSKGMIEQVNTISVDNVITSALVQHETKSHGIDILLHHKINTFDGWLGYSYNNSRINNPAGRSYPLSGETPHSLKAVAQYTWGSLVFAVSGYYSSGTPYSLPVVNSTVLNNVGEMAYILTAPEQRNSKRLADETRIDLSLNYHYKAPWYRINLGISVYNLFDQENTWYKSFSMQDDQLIIKDVHKLGFKPTVFLRFGF